MKVHVSFTCNFVKFQLKCKEVFLFFCFIMSVQKRVMNNELLSVVNFVTPFACYRLFYIFVCWSHNCIFFLCCVFVFYEFYRKVNF